VLDAWPDSEADYNHMRRMLSRALTLLLGDVMHPARRAILKRIPRAKEARTRKADLSVPRFLEIIEKVPADRRAPYWTMLITGMRTGEYLRCGREQLRADLHAVDVPGRKTEGSAALVSVDPSLWHWVEAGIPSPRQYKWLREHWKRAARAAGYPTIRLHDIRHATANAGLAGGASLADVQALMRHADPAMTMDYAATTQSRAAARGLAKVLPMPVRHRAKRGRSA
jgi:integrase